MIKVILLFQWRTQRQGEQEELWKVVEMPFLPMAGMAIWCGDDGGCLDCSTVEKITWWEEYPQWCIVSLKIVEICGDAAQFISWMKENGWHHEATEHHLSAVS